MGLFQAFLLYSEYNVTLLGRSRWRVIAGSGGFAVGHRCVSAPPQRPPAAVTLRQGQGALQAYCTSAPSVCQVIGCAHLCPEELLPILAIHWAADTISSEV